MRKVDWVCIFFCAIAAGLCYIDCPASCLFFVVSSTIGIVDAVKRKILSSSIINAIFFALNFAFLIEWIAK